MDEDIAIEVFKKIITYEHGKTRLFFYYCSKGVRWNGFEITELVPHIQNNCKKLITEEKRREVKEKSARYYNNRHEILKQTWKYERSGEKQKGKDEGGEIEDKEEELEV